jgi:hypothetical protein
MSVSQIEDAFSVFREIRERLVGSALPYVFAVLYTVKQYGSVSTIQIQSINTRIVHQKKHDILYFDIVAYSPVYSSGNHPLRYCTRIVGNSNNS